MLDLLGDPQLPPQPVLVLADLGVEPGVLDRDRDLARERGEHLHVLLGETVERRRLEVEDADHPVLVHERHHELGSGLRHEAHVARVLPHVADEDGLPRPHGGAAEALGDRDAAPLLGGAEVDGLAQHQLVAALVEQEDPEHLVVDHALDDLGQPLQELVEVEDRGRLLADLVERREEPRVPPRLAVERRVLDRHREVPGQDLEGGARRRSEELDRRALDVEDTHQVVLAHERDREFGHHVGEEGDVARVLRNVGHEDRLALGGGRPHDPLSHSHPEPGGHLEVVALDVGRREKALGVRQEDVENAVVHDLPQLAGDRGEELVGVEDGVDLPDEGQEVREELAREGRLHAGRRGHAAC